jgi:hypothetical protein
MRHCLKSVLLSAAMASLFNTSCSSEKVPGLGRVTGTVTMDGQPVADAAISFEGTKPGEPPSLGKTDASGNYELYYSRGHKGATIGEHTVYITTYRGPTDEDPQPKKETIPAKYNGKSELKTTVSRGQNKLDFALKSGGEIIQPTEEPEAPKKKAKTATGCG